MLVSLVSFRADGKRKKINSFCTRENEIPGPVDPPRRVNPSLWMAEKKRDDLNPAALVEEWGWCARPLFAGWLNKYCCFFFNNRGWKCLRLSDLREWSIRMSGSVLISGGGSSLRLFCTSHLLPISARFEKVFRNTKEV